MNASQRALRRANPRLHAGFAESVEAVWARIDVAGEPAPAARAPRRPLARVSLAGAAALAAVVAVSTLTIGSPGGGPGVEDAGAAVKRAATATAASAARSGTAVVRITHGGDVWAGRTVRWNGGDLEVAREMPVRPGSEGAELLVVDGMMYGLDPREGGWIVLGSPDSIDPGSGTTPDEYLAAVREDTRGGTLRRIGEGLTGLTTSHLADGSTVHTGTVAAGSIARKTGFKEGEHLRVLPFGYVAHDAAADPASPLAAAVTVTPDGTVREIAVSWGDGASAWKYTVTYSELGTTPALEAPANAKPLKRSIR
jgi:hypothetical protein